MRPGFRSGRRFQQHCSVDRGLPGPESGLQEQQALPGQPEPEWLLPGLQEQQALPGQPEPEWLLPELQELQELRPEPQTK